MEKASDPEFEKLRNGEWGKIITAERLALYEKYLGQKEFLKDSTGIDLTRSQGATLRRRDIESLSDLQKRKLPLIHPFDPKDPDKLLKPASCTLRLGCHYRVNGEEGFLGPDNPTLVIPRHGITMVTTFEWLNIPTFLIARWNLRVHRVYDGLVWVGGPQVDPGYQGFLFCPLYNLSNTDQVLTYGRRLFIIDFSLTTPCDEKENGKDNVWKPREPRDTFTFWGLDVQKIHSGPENAFQEIRKEIADFKKEVSDDTNKLDSKIQKSQDWVIIAIGLIVAILAVISTFGLGSIKWHIDAMGTAFVILALVLSVIAIYISLRKQRKPK